MDAVGTCGGLLIILSEYFRSLTFLSVSVDFSLRNFLILQDLLSNTTLYDKNVQFRFNTASRSISLVYLFCQFVDEMFH